MTLSPEDRERRRHSLGASDTAAILGLHSPWRTGADVQLEKLYPTAELADSGAIRVGNVVERGLCEWAAEQAKLEIVLSPPGIYSDLMPVHANLDALAPGECVIEAKSTGQHDEWGEPGTDEVPDHVIVQVQQQMALAGVGYALVPCLFVGLRRDVQLYRVERDDELIADLLERAREWWGRHVVERQPVPGALPDLSLLKRIQRSPSSERVIDPMLVYGYIAAQKNASVAKKVQELAQAELLAALGDAEAGIDNEGNVLVSYLQRSRKEYTVPAGVYRQIRIERRA